MDQTLIDRYQPGGDIYAALASKYSTGVANAAATAALTGSETATNQAITDARFGNALDTSTASIFYSAITTDPLAAPLAGAETIAANSIKDFVKSPAVMFTLVVIGFFLLGGGAWLARQLAKR